LFYLKNSLFIFIIMSKNLYCIRHGLSLHNKLYHKHGSKTFYDKDYIDTMLLPEGKRQARMLGETWNEINKVESVIVSPLKRSLETTINIFIIMSKNLY